MGMFKDLFKLTREAQELKRNTPTPSMGEMVGQLRETVEGINAQQGDSARLLAEGIPGTAIIREMGTPERGATWFNLMLDLEVHPRTRDPYRVANEYLVPGAVPTRAGPRATGDDRPRRPGEAGDRLGQGAAGSGAGADQAGVSSSRRSDSNPG